MFLELSGLLGKYANKQPSSQRRLAVLLVGGMCQCKLGLLQRSPSGLQPGEGQTLCILRVLVGGI